MGEIIIKNDTRILTPLEYEQIRGHLNTIHRVRFDASLFSYMRDVEFGRFILHPDWFMPERMCIHLPVGSILKVKAKQKERDVLLSNIGVRAIVDLKDHIRKGDIKPISRRGWNDDLTRAARKAGLDTTGIVPKMARKTFISWLMSSFPRDSDRITSASGHSHQTLIDHYLNTPFSTEERAKIYIYTQGWGGLQ